MVVYYTIKFLNYEITVTKKLNKREEEKARQEEEKARDAYYKLMEEYY